jgi:hypothetical protein
MAKQGFTRNSKTIRDILKTDENLHAALVDVGRQVLAEMDDPEAFLEEYETDRAVVGIVVPADSQAKHGTATRAAQKVAGG